MEFQYDLRRIAHDEIIKIDNSLLPVGYQNPDDSELRTIISNIVDKMGQASGVAQELRSPITSAEKLMRSDHILYLMTEETSQGHFVVVGLLKMGWKKLYLYNKKGSQTEAQVYCLLDFYIHETRQRHGYGIKLMEYMLKDNQIQAKQLAVDQPTNKLLQFLWKYFNLSKLVNQGNNFVIFEEFFENDGDAEKESGTDRSSGYKRQATFGRHGAARQEDCMANILYGGQAKKDQNDYENKVEQQKTEIKQQQQQQKIEQHYVEIQQHVSDESDGHKSNNSHPKLDIKNFHTQLW